MTELTPEEYAAYVGCLYQINEIMETYEQTLGGRDFVNAKNERVRIDVRRIVLSSLEGK